MRPFVALVVGLLAAGAILVIGLQIRSNSRQPDPSTTFLVEPTTTPLQDSIRESKAAKRKTGRAKGSSSPAPSSRSGSGSRSGSRAPQSSTRPGDKQRAQSPSKPRKRKTTTSPQKPAQPAQQPSTPPSEPSPQPGVTVTVPLPRACGPVKLPTCP